MIPVEELPVFDPVVFHWQWITDEQYHHKRWLRRQRYEKDPRPANVWIGFRSYGAHYYRDLKRKGPRVLDAVIKQLYEKCKKTPEGKWLLELIEEYELVRHDQEYPDYKYAPRHREPKDPVEQDNHAMEEALFIPHTPIMTRPLVRSASLSSAGSRNTTPATLSNTLPLAGHAVSLSGWATSGTRTVGNDRHKRHAARGLLSMRDQTMAATVNPTVDTGATSASAYLSVEAPTSRPQPLANTVDSSLRGAQASASPIVASYHSAFISNAQNRCLKTSSDPAHGGEYILTTPGVNAQSDSFAPQLCSRAMSSNGHQYAHDAVAGSSTYALDGYQTHADEYTGMPDYYEQATNVSSGPYYQESYYQDPTYPVAGPSTQYRPAAGPMYDTQQSLGLGLDPAQEQQSMPFDYFAMEIQQPNALGLDIAQMPRYGYNDPSMDSTWSYGSESYPGVTPGSYDLLGACKQREAMSFSENAYYYE